MTTLPAVVLEPHGTPDSAVLWLHGLGASGHDFVPIVPHLGLERTRFIFPHAPERPVTLNGGARMPAWYDITSLAPGPGREPAAHIEGAATWITAWLQRITAEGVPAERTVLAGFSQGGALALHVAHRHPERLAGLMVLSAYLLLEDRFAEEAHAANADTPALFCHGTADDVVPIARGRRAHRALTSAPRDVRWHDFPMGHQVCMDEIQVIAGWLHERLR